MYLIRDGLHPCRLGQLFCISGRGHSRGDLFIRLWPLDVYLTFNLGGKKT